MAKVTTGILAEALHGSAGSVVFVRTRTGLVIRPRTIGRNPRSAAQVAMRGHFAKAVAAYRALTPAQADAWNAYARSTIRTDLRDGTCRTQSAYAAFLGLATKF